MMGKLIKTVLGTLEDADVISQSYMRRVGQALPKADFFVREPKHNDLVDYLRFRGAVDAYYQWYEANKKSLSRAYKKDAYEFLYMAIQSVTDMREYLSQKGFTEDELY